MPPRGGRGLRGGRALGLAGLAGLLLAGCAVGRIVDGYYVNPGKGYRVGLPEGWLAERGTPDLTLRHPTLGAGVMVHGTCEGNPPRRPLPLLARHLRFGLRDVEVEAQEELRLGGHPALETRWRGRLDGRPVVGRGVIVKARGCVYDLDLVARPESFEQVQTVFGRLLGSFELLGGTP